MGDRFIYFWGNFSNLYKLTKKYDIENIISLDPLVNETENEHGIQPEGNSEYDIHAPIINDDANDANDEVAVDIRLDDILHHRSENDMGVMQNESEEMLQDEWLDNLRSTGDFQEFLSELDYRRNFQEEC